MSHLAISFLILIIQDIFNSAVVRGSCNGKSRTCIPGPAYCTTSAIHPIFSAAGKTDFRPKYHDSFPRTMLLPLTYPNPGLHPALLLSR